MPIIKKDLQDMKAAADEAAVPYQIKIGGELIEAKSDPKLSSKIIFDDWVEKTFRIKASTATIWIRKAGLSADGAVFKSAEDVYGGYDRDKRAHHQPKWFPPVKDLVDRAQNAARLFRERQLSSEKERAAERRLALRLIDIGYKVLSVELHPDKRGGSHEAMQRLNAVRARLRDAA